MTVDLLDQNLYVALKEGKEAAFEMIFRSYYQPLCKYVEDDESGARIADASVFEKNTLTSSITNEFDYYKIKLEKKGNPFRYRCAGKITRTRW